MWNLIKFITASDKLLKEIIDQTTSKLFHAVINSFFRNWICATNYKTKSCSKFGISFLHFNAH